MVLDLKMEIKTTKKEEMKEILERKDLGKKTGSKLQGIINRI